MILLQNYAPQPKCNTLLMGVLRYGCRILQQFRQLSRLHMADAIMQWGVKSSNETMTFLKLSAMVSESHRLYLLSVCNLSSITDNFVTKIVFFVRNRETFSRISCFHVYFCLLTVKTPTSRVLLFLDKVVIL